MSDGIDVSGKVIVPGYIEPHTHPWCLYSPSSLLEVAVPDGTTTLVYDNLFFFLAHGVGRACGASSTDARRARAHPLGGADRAADGAGRGGRSIREAVASMLAWPEVVATGEITNWIRWRRASRGGRRDRRRQGRAQAGRRPQRRRVLRPPERAQRGRHLLRPRGDHRRGGPARLRLGMWTMLRQSSLRPDLEPMLRGLLEWSPRAAADVHDRRRRRRASMPSPG